MFIPPGAEHPLNAGASHEAPVKSPPRNRDRKSTRLNSSHLVISYAVFCLKKKNALLLTTGVAEVWAITCAKKATRGELFFMGYQNISQLYCTAGNILNDVFCDDEQ